MLFVRNFDCNLNLTAITFYYRQGAEREGWQILNEITLSTIKKLKRHQQQFKCIKHTTEDDEVERMEE